mgnify:CR=1 FL=1
MKKGLIALIIAAVIVLCGFMWIKNTYNNMVSGDENVQAAWSQVENVYQRRADLIPNLLSTVKGKYILSDLVSFIPLICIETSM